MTPETTTKLSTEDFVRQLSGNKIKSFIVQRKATVSISTDIIQCAHAVTALITTDEHTDYESLLRQTSRDGMIVGVEFEELSGATVVCVNEKTGEEEIYDFNEEELKEIKDTFGIK